MFKLDKKTEILNRILLVLIFVSFIIVFSYTILAVCVNLGIDVVSSEYTLKTNLANVLIFVGVPNVLVIMSVYKYFEKKYMGYLKEEQEEAEDESN